MSGLCNYFIVITGETGVGKTDFSDHLSSRLPIEIINGDVGQMYTPTTIGTAKPDWRAACVTHHLFDYITTPTDFSVAAYRTVVTHLLSDIWARGALPVIVGGSSFYIRSLFFSASEHLISSDGSNDTMGHNFPEDVRAAITRAEISGDSIPLWNILFTIDPERAQAIKSQDTYRLRRALDIWYTHGVLPSTCKQRFDPIAPTLCFFLTRDRAELYERINRRVEIMVRDGWIDEVKGLDEQWRQFLKRKKLIGYPEIITFLDGTQCNDHYAALIACIQQNTRRYAKRQGTFWRMAQREIAMHNTCHLAPQLHEYNLTLSPVHLYLDHMVSCIDRLHGHAQSMHMQTNG